MTELQWRTHDVLLRSRALSASLVGSGGAGASSWLGPVELTLGACAGALGDWSAAREDLSRASALSRDIGAPGLRVEAEGGPGEGAGTVRGDRGALVPLHLRARQAAGL